MDQLNNFAVEVIRVSVEVGTEGKLGGTARVENVEGTWREITDCVNSMASNLTQQVRAIATVTEAVAAGDLERTIDVDAKGEILALKDTVNNMVRQLRTFGAEVTRVALEVGTEGKLGGRAYVEKWVLLQNLLCLHFGRDSEADARTSGDTAAFAALGKSLQTMSTKWCGDKGP